MKSKRTCKKMLAYILTLVMLLSIIPDTASISYAQEVVGETTEEVSAEEVNEVILPEDTTENEKTESTTEIVEEEMVTEHSTESVTESAEQSTEVNVEEETTTEIVEESIPKEVTTETSTEDVGLEEKAVETSLTESETADEEDTAEEAEKLIPIVEEVLEADKAGYKTIYSDGSWGGGIIWYVNDNGKKHYVFCLDKGSTMYSGKYSGLITTGYSGKDAFRVSTALNYFKTMNGGWYGTKDYALVQQVIWNYSDSDLMDYINHAWRLANNNGSRASSSASYDSRIKAVTNVSSKSGRKAIAESLTAKKLTVGDDGYATKTYTLKGSAWKYFAKGQFPNHTVSTMNGSGAIEVMGLYEKDGTQITESYVGDNYVDTSGQLHVKIAPNTGVGTKENPVTVIMKVTFPYQGANNIEYLQTGSGVQNLTFNTSASTSAYFAMEVYAETTVTYRKNPYVFINKVDEFGNPVTGCTFQLEGTSGEALEKMEEPVVAVIDSSDDGFEIEYAGDYKITEIAVPNSEMQLMSRAVEFSAEWETDEAGEQKLVLHGGYDPDLGLVVGKDNPLVKSGNNYIYTATNNYNDGRARLTKYGNVLVSYTNGKFVYEKKTLSDVTFDFYAAENIYCADELIFTKGTKLTNNFGWGLETLLDGKPTGMFAHTVYITNSSATDENGEIVVSGLPKGRYYAIETNTPDGFVKSTTRYYFNVTAGETVDINGSTGIINEQVPAVCHVFKVDADSSEPLSGGEFTIYANVNNTNHDKQPLFSSNDTVDVVVSRDLSTGEEKKVSGTWVPIQVVSTDSQGMAEFTDLPAGKYLVVETKAPEGYNLAEESYEFTHTYSAEMSTSGYNFEHTFKDVKKRTHDIKKYAEKAVLDTNNISQDLYIYEEIPVAGVVFGIYAAEDIYNTVGVKVAEAGEQIGTCTTDDEGIATCSDIMFAGDYYFKELQTADDDIYILDETEYPFSVSSESSGVINAEPIINDLYKGSIKVIKTDGETKVALEGVTFNLMDSSSVVIGTFVTDANGEITINNLPIGTYYLQEIETKKGYKLDDTIQEIDLTKLNLDQVINIENELYKGSIKVIKTDGETEVALEGVEFDLLDSENNVLGHYITDENGEILIDDLVLGTYYIRETKTKKGYKLEEKAVKVIISEEDLDQVVELKNYRNDTKITIKTDTTFSGSGQVRTGDASPIGFIMILFFLSSFGVAFFAKKKDMKLPLLSVRAKKLMAIVLVLAGVTCIGGLTVKAAAELREISSTELKDAEYNGKVYKYALQKQYETSNQEEEIVFDEKVDGMKLADVQYETLETILQKETLETTRDYKDLLVKDESKVDDTITLNGNVYELQDIIWSEVPNMETVSYTVDYGFQTAEPTPEATYEYTYTSPVTKKDNTVMLPFVRMEKGSEAWVDGFSATVTFHNIDGKYFKLGNHEFEYDSNKLSLTDSDFKHLVKMLGYDTSKYRLTSIAWSGKEYKKNDQMCRDAKAIGQQYAASYKAYYEDEVENGKIYTAHALYACEVEVPADEAAPTYVREATAYYEDAGVWTNIITFVTEHKVVSVAFVGILLFIIIVIVLLLRRTKRTVNQVEDTYTE